MPFAFFFPPSPLEVVIFAGAGFLILLPEIHRGYCHMKWLQSGDGWWLDPDEQWKPPRWLLAVAWLLAWMVAAALFSRNR